MLIRSRNGTLTHNGRQYETCRFGTQNFKLKNKFDMKKKLTIRQRIKACFILLVSNSTLSYVIDLEERCKKANFAPFSLRVPEEGEYFVWNEETIQNAENWLKRHHPELAE